MQSEIGHLQWKQTFPISHRMFQRRPQGREDSFLGLPKMVLLNVVTKVMGYAVPHK